MTKNSRKSTASSSSPTLGKKAARKSSAKTPSSADHVARGKTAGSLRVRMYRVGFGDFFLLTVPADSGPQHILIDCGVTGGRTGKGDIGTIKDAVADMANETKKNLSLIIVTHRHMDHIIGFSRCAEIFKQFKVEAIWMPIWETEYDAKISASQAEMTSLALGAQNYLALAADDIPEKNEMLAML